MWAKSTESGVIYRDVDIKDFLLMINCLWPSVVKQLAQWSDWKRVFLKAYSRLSFEMGVKQYVSQNHHLSQSIDTCGQILLQYE